MREHLIEISCLLPAHSVPGQSQAQNQKASVQTLKNIVKSRKVVVDRERSFSISVNTVCYLTYHLQRMLLPSRMLRGVATTENCHEPTVTADRSQDAAEVFVMHGQQDVVDDLE